MIQVPPARSLLAGQWNWPLWFVAAAVITGVAALASIWLGRHHSIRAKTVWTVIVLVIPILGPIAWFVLGRERRKP
jgi:Na+-driven multidrug efflux pump